MIRLTNDVALIPIASSAIEFADDKFSVRSGTQCQLDGVQCAVLGEGERLSFEQSYATRFFEEIEGRSVRALARNHLTAQDDPKSRKD